jgi:hypothetical protein
VTARRPLKAAPGCGFLCSSSPFSRRDVLVRSLKFAEGNDGISFKEQPGPFDFNRFSSQKK